MSECCYQGNLASYVCGALVLLSLVICLPVRASENLDEPYLQLLAASCRICHSDGVTRLETPSLQDLTAADIKRLLSAFKADSEPATIMNRIASALSDEEIDQLAAMIGR